MHQPIALLCATLLLCTGPAQAGTVVVDFEHPDRYTDVGPRHDAERVQNTLRSALQTLAADHLPAGHSLHLAVTDIDLAGEIEPGWRQLHDVRVMGRVPDWPRISLRYSLRDGARVLAEGSEVVSDIAYLSRSALSSGSGSLPYERRMLADWFDNHFGKTAAH